MCPTNKRGGEELCKRACGRRAPSMKRSQTDACIDSVSLAVFLLQALLALFLGLAGIGWAEETGRLHWYLAIADPAEQHHLGHGRRRGFLGRWYEAGVVPLRYVLLMSTMIPLSIQVSHTG